MGQNGQALQGRSGRVEPALPRAVHGRVDLQLHQGKVRQLATMHEQDRTAPRDLASGDIPQHQRGQQAEGRVRPRLVLVALPRWKGDVGVRGARKGSLCTVPPRPPARRAAPCGQDMLHSTAAAAPLRRPARTRLGPKSRAPAPAKFFAYPACHLAPFRPILLALDKNMLTNREFVGQSTSFHLEN